MLTLWLLACHSPPPLPEGATLPACWGSPNCVSTQAPADDSTHHRPPVPRPEGLEVADVEALVVALDGCAVLSRTDTHLRAECTLPSGWFTDDLDVLLVEDQVHARSSSRLGYGDMGVNRARVDALFAAVDGWSGGQR